MESVIKIKNLTYAYDDQQNALDQVSLEIQKGSYTVILGHNGSGKSTLAKIMIGLMKAKEGTILIDNIELNEENISQIRNKVGIVFQNPDNQFIGATVRDDIAFGLENHCVDPLKMDQIIQDFSEKVGMEAYLEKEPTMLSGGQKQRVAVAGVLSMLPAIIIFDEATSMLDPKGKKEIKDLIEKMRKIYLDLTFISITHDVDEAFYADQVIVLNDGKILMQGTPSQIFQKEQLLIDINLDIPFTYKLQSELKKLKINVQLNTIEKMVKELCQ